MSVKFKFALLFSLVLVLCSLSVQAGEIINYSTDSSKYVFVNTVNSSAQDPGLVTVGTNVSFYKNVWYQNSTFQTLYGNRSGSPPDTVSSWATNPLVGLNTGNWSFYVDDLYSSGAGGEIEFGKGVFVTAACKVFMEQAVLSFHTNGGNPVSLTNYRNVTIKVKLDTNNSKCNYYVYNTSTGANMMTSENNNYLSGTWTGNITIMVGDAPSKRVFDNFYVYQGNARPSATAADSVPVLSLFNVTSAIGDGTVWNTNNQTNVNVIQSTPTVTFTTDISGNCSISRNAAGQNYSTMIANDSNAKCGTTLTTSHTCTLPATKALPLGKSNISIACISAGGLEGLSSQTGDNAIFYISTPNPLTVSVNATYFPKSQTFNFNASWQNDTPLSIYIFSNNQSGTWLNVSNGTFATSSNAEANLTLTASAGTTIGWMFFANTTASFNQTPIQTLTISNYCITPIENQNISTAGNVSVCNPNGNTVYQLNDSDVNGSIVVRADDVFLDLNTALLRGNHTNGSIGIHVNGSKNVTITSGVFDGFKRALFTVSNGSIRILNNSIQNGNTGIYFESHQVENPVLSIISNNTLSNLTTYYGGDAARNLEIFGNNNTGSVVIYNFTSNDLRINISEARNNRTNISLGGARQINYLFAGNVNVSIINATFQIRSLSSSFDDVRNVSNGRLLATNVPNYSMTLALNQQVEAGQFGNPVVSATAPNGTSTTSGTIILSYSFSNFTAPSWCALTANGVVSGNQSSPISPSNFSFGIPSLGVYSWFVSCFEPTGAFVTDSNNLTFSFVSNPGPGGGGGGGGGVTNMGSALNCVVGERIYEVGGKQVCAPPCDGLFVLNPDGSTVCVSCNEGFEFVDGSCNLKTVDMVSVTSENFFVLLGKKVNANNPFFGLVILAGAGLLLYAGLRVMLHG